MPIYNYRCEKCQYEFERMRRINDMEDGGCCPNCQNDSTKKLMTAPASIRGSGAGWHGKKKVAPR
ncbi:zinc ribbon domain-containing protein [bacterium]|nr:zinc ribbon domain-containing protein [bacterium]